MFEFLFRFLFFAYLYHALNTVLVKTYWQIGQQIVEFEQNGNTKDIYGKSILENLSKDLSFQHGKGFSLSNLERIRQFYIVYPISAELLHQLDWTRFVELMKIDDPMERSFYEKQSLTCPKFLKSEYTNTRH